MWLIWIAGIVAVVVVLAGAALAAGAYRWRAETLAVDDGMASSRRAPSTLRYDAARLEGLPVPVRRYLDLALTDGQPMIVSARFTQEGEFLLGTGRWVPFTAAHEVMAAPPSFDWDARMRVAPGLQVFVRDAWVEGEGRLHAALLGLWTVASAGGTPEIVEGEALRYLAEAVWYPTVLLPGDGLRWEAIDATTARARLSAGRVSVALEFRFGEDGMVAEVEAAGRPRLVDGTSVPTPWRGRFSGYADERGMRIPHAGEVEWLLPEGPQPYWRGRVTAAVYELTR